MYYKLGLFELKLHGSNKYLTFGAQSCFLLKFDSNKIPVPTAEMETPSEREKAKDPKAERTQVAKTFAAQLWFALSCRGAVLQRRH